MAVGKQSYLTGQVGWVVMLLIWWQCITYYCWTVFRWEDNWEWICRKETYSLILPSRQLVTLKFPYFYQQDWSLSYQETRKDCFLRFAFEENKCGSFEKFDIVIVQLVVFILWCLLYSAVRCWFKTDIIELVTFIWDWECQGWQNWVPWVLCLVDICKSEP